VRKAVLLVLLAAAWEIYARALDNPLLFPTFTSTVGALLSGIARGEIPTAGFYTLSLLLKGYVAGLFFAALLTAFASVSRIGADLLETLTAMFNPLPSIALLPLATPVIACDQVCIPQRRTVRCSIVRKTTFSTNKPKMMTVSRPAKTSGILS